VPSIYTIEGTSRSPKRSSRKKRSRKQTRQQKKFAKAAKYCSRRARSDGLDYRACMVKELG